MSRGFTIPKSPVRFSLELLLIMAIAAAILLRIINLGSREFWYDEVLSLILSNGQQVNYKAPGDLPVALRDYTALLSLPAESSLGEVIKTVKNVFNGILGDVHPPLSYLSLHFWMRLFGNSEAAMRSLMALMSVGAIGSAYGLGRIVLGHRGGLLLAALLGTNPFFLFHSLNARMYAPLVLWTTLSTWAMLELMEARGEELKVRGYQVEDSDQQPQPANLQPSKSSVSRQILWNVVLIGSVAAGLLTQYLFAYWVITLGVFVLVFDRRRWWQQGLRLGAGILLWMPWFFWGTRHQSRLREVGGQFSKGTHLGDIAQTLGTHLLLGDWVTSLPEGRAIIGLPEGWAIVAGCVVFVVLLTCTLTLWRQGERRKLGVALILGIFPLLLALTVDIITRKYSIGFGGGRSMLFILPGCLLLLALWLERSAGRWREPAAAVLLLLYLSISIGDFSTRQRWLFHDLANLIQQNPTTPTLVAMNSRAWGHILRLAYYIPPTAPVSLLAQNPGDLAPAFDKILTTEAERYPRVIWLNSARPVNKAPKTEAEKQQIQKDIQRVLNSKFKLVKTQPLSGTMILDEFTLNLYTR
jgi:uncharacterized membrane protein